MTDTLRSPAPPLRFSSLKHIARSPAHYQYKLRTRFQPTAGMRLGTLVHREVLGVGFDDEEDTPSVIYNGDRKGNAWKAFAAEHADAEIFTASELEKAKPIAAAVLASDMAAPWLQGEREKLIRWERDGRPWQGRLDVAGQGFVADLKTTTDASPRTFLRNATRMLYHAQMACYCDAHGVNEAVLIAVEVAPPYVVQVYRLTSDMLDEGRKAVRAMLETLAVCEASGVWPGYGLAPMDFDRPDWMVGEADEDDADSDGDE